MRSALPQRKAAASADVVRHSPAVPAQEAARGSFEATHAAITSDGPHPRVPVSARQSPPQAPLSRAGDRHLFITTAAITLGLGLAYNPVNAFAMTGTGIVIVLVAVYILMNAACIGYFAASGSRRY